MEEPFIRRHSKKFLVLLVLVGAGAAVLYFSPFREEFASWRASSLVGEAREYAEAGNWSEVERTALASLQIERSLAAVRLLTEAAMAQEKPEAAAYGFQLYDFEEATAADKTLGLKLALDVRALEAANELVGKLSEEELLEPGIHYQVVRAFIMSKQVGAAMRLADRPEMEPHDPRIDLMIVGALAEDSSEGARAEARARLRDVLENENRETALAAMMLLFSPESTWLPRSLAEIAVARFKGDPDLTIEQELVVKALQIGLGQVERAEVVSQVVKDYRKDHLLTLLSWLTKLGDHERVAALSDNPSAKEQEEILRLRFPALAKLKKWETLKEELDTLPAAFPEPMLAAMKAMAAHQLEDPAAAQRLWIKAMDAAKLETYRNFYLILADTAEDMEKSDEAMEAVIAAINHPKPILPDEERLMKTFAWLIDQNDPQRLLEFSEQLITLVPNHPVYLNNYFFLKGVYGDVTTEDLDKMAELVKNHPDVALFRCSFSFLLLRGGEPERALEELEKLDEAGGEATETGKAVKAKALEVIGEIDQAKKAAEEVDYESLDEAQLEYLRLSAD